jgi:hypothetical protein
LFCFSAKAEIYKNAVEVVVGSYEGSERDFKTILELVNVYNLELYRENEMGEQKNV